MGLQKVHFFIYVQVLRVQKQPVILFKQNTQIRQKSIHPTVMTISLNQNVFCQSTKRFSIHYWLHVL